MPQPQNRAHMRSDSLSMVYSVLYDTIWYTCTRCAAAVKPKTNSKLNSKMHLLLHYSGNELHCSSAASRVTGRKRIVQMKYSHTSCSCDTQRNAHGRNSILRERSAYVRHAIFSECPNKVPRDFRCDYNLRTRYSLPNSRKKRIKYELHILHSRSTCP